MNALDRLLPKPRLREISHVDLAAPPARVWEMVRHGDLARSAFIRALFALRALPSRLAGRPPESTELCIDALVSTPDRPGFQVLADDPPREVAVGAVGKVWQGEIPFVHVDDGAAFAAFAEPGFVKVAWALTVEPIGAGDARLAIEVRVGATDDASWEKFEHYFRFIGIGSRFIRRTALASLARELGTPAQREQDRPLPGDELLPDARGQLTHGITIDAPPERIWPWLVQMGGGRGGFYSIDALDNGGARSAREIHPELGRLEVGQVIPATPEGGDGFEVIRADEPRALILGGLFDPAEGRQLAFAAPRPPRFWQVTWAFVLEPIDARSTRLHVRARAASSPSERLHAAWIRPVHWMMETSQLRHLKARVEGTLPRDDARDVIEGLGGAARMAFAMLTPFLAERRARWGLDPEEARRALPGDEIVPEPRWSWTHGVEIDASAAAVWPWIAQIGATRGGFYSYQWLENVIGCEVRNAEVTRPEWEAKPGDPLALHPKAPPLEIVAVERGRWFVARGAADPAAPVQGSWLLFVEPLGDERCRVISRYRVSYPGDLASRAAFGALTLGSIGGEMDRRMLLGVKERAERWGSAAEVSPGRADTRSPGP
jgi:hypothetical protein